MSFPSEPNAPVNGWVARMCRPLLGWCRRRQFLPDLNVFNVSETPNGLWTTLREEISAGLAASSSGYRLQLIAANDSGTPKIRVRLGYVANQIADAGMTDPTDEPPFLLTLPSTADTYYIYCDVTMIYDADTTIWSRDSGTANAVTYDTDAPIDHPNDATTIHVYLGAVEVTSISGGYAARAIEPGPFNSGDRWVAREALADPPYNDASGG